MRMPLIFGFSVREMNCIMIRPFASTVIVNDPVIALDRVRTRVSPNPWTRSGTAAGPKAYDTESRSFIDSILDERVNALRIQHRGNNRSTRQNDRPVVRKALRSRCTVADDQVG